MKLKLTQRIRNIWKLSEIESLEDFDKKKMSGFFRFKRPAIIIETKTEVEKLAELIEKNG